MRRRAGERNIIIVCVMEKGSMRNCCSRSECAVVAILGCSM